MIYRNRTALDFTVNQVPDSPRPASALFASPDYFGVEYVINPHMEHQVGKVDKNLAFSQWSSLVQTYQSLGIRTSVVKGIEALPDMVFCANQTLPGLDADGKRIAVLSNMANPERAGEVKYFERVFAASGYGIRRINRAIEFEGCGDLLWHPGRRLLWCGHGFRTDVAAAPHLADLFDCRIIVLELTNPAFYHLDTCLCLLTHDTAMIVRSALTASGQDLIEALIPNVIEVPEKEGLEQFACNAHCPDGTTVVIQAGCQTTVARLRERGFEIAEIETSEFIKAGGSVFCMKQMFW